jgi:hypothetical protein
MSSNSITEKDGSKDNYYVQTVSMDAATPPAPQMQPIQRTFGNPVRLSCYIDIMSAVFNDPPGASRHDGLWYRLPVLVNTDARVKERRLTQFGHGFCHLVSFQDAQTNIILTQSLPATVVSLRQLWACGRCTSGMFPRFCMEGAITEFFTVTLSVQRFLLPTEVSTCHMVLSTCLR